MEPPRIDAGLFPDRVNRPVEFGEIRRSLFESNVEAYGEGRPGYPSEVFGVLSRSCGLVPGCSVLEIGPGAGQATGPLLDAGAKVVAVEVVPPSAYSWVSERSIDGRSYHRFDELVAEPV